jgi:zinc transport system ATP-binding protein
MYRIIRELNRDGLTMLMVSHDVSGAVREAGKILHMDVTPLFFGNTDDYLHSEPGRRFLSESKPEPPHGSPEGGASDV